MKIDGPPLDNHCRPGRSGGSSALSWLIGLCMTVFLTVTIAAGAAVISHGQRIAVLEIQMTDIRASLVAIEHKLDRLLNR